MPFKSNAQRKWMFAAEKRGEVPKGTAERWAKHTPKSKDLPEHVKTAMFEDKLARILFEKVAQAPAFSFNPAATDSAMNVGTKVFQTTSKAPGGGALSTIGGMIGQHPAQALPRAAANLGYLRSVKPFVPPADTGVFNQGIRRLEQGQRWAQDTVPNLRGPNFPIVGYTKPGAATQVSLGAAGYWGKRGEADKSMAIARNIFPQQTAQHTAYVQKNIPPVPTDSIPAKK
jgi:hypothetical protein